MENKRTSLLFISSLDITGDRSKTNGVTKKILLEISSFEHLGFNVDYIFSKDHIAYFQNYKREEFVICKTKGRYYKDIDSIVKIIPNIIHDKDYDYVYLRYEGMSPQLVKFMNWLKRKSKNKQIRINAELPTFQSRWEPGTNLKGKINFLLRKLVNNMLSYPIDKIITFDDQDKIFGRPTIKIENFADVFNIPIKKEYQSSEDIHMVGIAQMTPSHGFDRVIKGLKIYYDSKPVKKVFFHIIGNGEIKSKWENLVEDYKLQQYVTFEGTKTSDEIKSYIDRCHIAIGSLAFFRKHTVKGSELKIREYCARGIPFVYSACEPILEGKKWCLKVPFDESPIDIKSILDFIDTINYKTTIPEIRQFAEQFCTPEYQLIKTL